jgi:hypothetical protein
MKYETLITYHSKDMSNVKFLQTDGQTNQKLYAPDLSIQGHKNSIQYKRTCLLL